MAHAFAFRRRAVRRAFSRAAANLVAVAAVSMIFGLKSYMDAQARTLVAASADAAEHAAAGGYPSDALAP